MTKCPNIRLFPEQALVYVACFVLTTLLETKLRNAKETRFKVFADSFWETKDYFYWWMTYVIDIIDITSTSIVSSNFSKGIYARLEL